MAEIIDGKAYAARLRAKVTEAVIDLKNNHGLTPGLAVVLVGEDPASQVYVRNKAKQTVEAGMESLAYRLPDTCLLYTSPSPRDGLLSRMPSSA